MASLDDLFDLEFWNTGQTRKVIHPITRLVQVYDQGTALGVPINNMDLDKILKIASEVNHI